MKHILIVISLLVATAAMAAPQAGDEIWQQIIGAKEAQCSQTIVEAAREMAKLRAQIAELEKQLAAKGGPNAK